MDEKTPISHLVLKTKPRKVLESLGIKYIGDFLSVDLDRIYEISGMGKGTREQLEILKDQILSGKMDAAAIAGVQAKMDTIKAWQETLSKLGAKSKKRVTAMGADTVKRFLAACRT